MRKRPRDSESQSQRDSVPRHTLVVASIRMARVGCQRSSGPFGSLRHRRLLRRHPVRLKDPDHAAAGPMDGAIMETAVLCEIVRTLTHQARIPACDPVIGRSGRGWKRRRAAASIQGASLPYPVDDSVKDVGQGGLRRLDDHSRYMLEMRLVPQQTRSGFQCGGGDPDVVGRDRRSLRPQLLYELAIAFRDVLVGTDDGNIRLQKKIVRFSCVVAWS